MQKTPILITGCQRSGTTLLRLILNSHPGIMSVDEDQFDYAFTNTYMHAPWFPNFVAFKLPRYAPHLSFIRGLEGIRVLWCIRDPVDVVWSMVKLQMALDDNSAVCWAAHPACAQSEILNSYWVLDPAVKDSLTEDMKRFRVIANKDPKARNREESIFTGALCWRIKNALTTLYEAQGIGFQVVRYESLVTAPEETIRDILRYAGAEWHDNVLRHHELHEGVSIGNTANTRPIDSRGVGRGAENFSPSELELIGKVCGETAESRGYPPG